MNRFVNELVDGNKVATYILIRKTDSIWAQKVFEVLVSVKDSNVFEPTNFNVMGNVEGDLQTQYIAVYTAKTDMPVELAINLACLAYPGYSFQLWDQLTDVNGNVIEWRLSYKEVEDGKE